MVRTSPLFLILVALTKGSDGHNPITTFIVKLLIVEFFFGEVWSPTSYPWKESPPNLLQISPLIPMCSFIKTQREKEYCTHSPPSLLCSLIQTQWGKSTTHIAFPTFCAASLKPNGKKSTAHIVLLFPFPFLFIFSLPSSLPSLLGEVDRTS